VVLRLRHQKRLYDEKKVGASHATLTLISTLVLIAMKSVMTTNPTYYPTQTTLSPTHFRTSLVTILNRSLKRLISTPLM
jgi:hypothetical protein